MKKDPSTLGITNRALVLRFQGWEGFAFTDIFHHLVQNFVINHAAVGPIQDVDAFLTDQLSKVRIPARDKSHLLDDLVSKPDLTSEQLGSSPENREDFIGRHRAYLNRSFFQ